MEVITVESTVFKQLMESIEELKIVVNEGFSESGSNQKIIRIWLNKHEVCQMLRISERSLQNYRKSGEVPYSKIGSKIFYRASDIKALMDTK